MEKKDIALIQLREGAKHYNSGDYVCSITLCGAAEEILGKIAKKGTGTNQLENEVIYLRSIYQYFSGKSPSNKKLIGKINRTKNEVKHNDSGINEWVSTNFENEAALIFIKAVKNYYDSFKEFPNDRNIKKLFDHLTL